MLGRSAGFLGSAVLLAMSLVSPAPAQQYKVGGLVIEQPWVRATPGGAKVAGGYMTIRNAGSEPDRLIGGSTPLAGRLEVHEMRLEDGIMRMREIRGGLEIAPGQKVELKPGGYHVMLMDLNAPLRQGETLKGQLRFEKAGTVEVEFKVEAVGAPHPAGKH
jgi:copper(I)-binding protein